ncbi:MAG: nicotinate-nucleotide--dimethylbenzimidazole phosphoribosyltransferase [Anaerolineae bacterium]
MSLLDQTIQSIRPLDAAAMDAARARQNNLTKPPGSLGRLEEISIQVAGITGQARPVIKEKAVVTCAGDHGVVAQGVSAFPQEVTPQMVYNFLNGGAAINVLARHVGARVVVVDAGVAADFEPQPGLVIKKVAHGTADMTQGPAMSRAQAVQAIEAGIEVVEDEIARGLSIVAVGDMGIGNTTPSSGIVAAITGRPVAEVTGRGTGINDEQLTHKMAVIRKALAVNRPDPDDALDVLSKVGGFEIGTIAGVVLGAAAHHIPAVIDGFISTAGALIAGELAPLAREYMIAAHASAEIGHRAMLDRLGLIPCLDFDLRLGEGTGAALVLSVVEAACKILDEMATFESAGVSDAV